MKQGIDLYNKLVKIKTTDRDIKIERYVLCRLGNLDEAMKCFARAKEFEGNEFF